MNPLKKEKIGSSIEDSLIDEKVENECASDLVLSKNAKDVYKRQISILDLYPSLREKVIDEIDLRGLHVQ